MKNKVLIVTNTYENYKLFMSQLTNPSEEYIYINNADIAYGYSKDTKVIFYEDYYDNPAYSFCLGRFKNLCYLKYMII